MAEAAGKVGQRRQGEEINRMFSKLWHKSIKKIKPYWKRIKSRTIRHPIKKKVKATAPAEKKTTRTKMSPDDIGWWADALGGAGVILGALLAIVGSLGWFFSWKSGKLKDAAYEKFQTEAKVEIARANESAALANLELARIDPVNLPIKSIRAEVYLVIRGSFFDVHYTNEPMAKRSCSISIAGKEGALVILPCSSFESLQMAKQEGGKDIIEGRTFSLSFSWPANDWSTAEESVKFWIDRTGASTSMLDKELIGAVISLPPTAKDCEILKGSCVLTINGVLQRKFTVPAKANPAVIFCPPHK